MNTATLAAPAVDRLHAVAIRRNGKVHNCAKGGSHYQLRVSLSGADQRFLGDVEGFITTAGNFLTRREAVAVGVRAGQLLTRAKGEDRPTYLEWVRSIVATGNRLAIRVKIADNEDNSSPERVHYLPAKDQERTKRYAKSLEILRPALEAA